MMLNSFTLVAFRKVGDAEKFEDEEDLETVLRIYVVLLLWSSIFAAVSPVDRQKYTIYSRKSGEKRRCINKTAERSRAHRSRRRTWDSSRNRFLTPYSRPHNPRE